MMEAKLATIISRETIKPSSPIHSHLQTYNLSPLDQLEHQHFIPMIFFYPNNCGDNLSLEAKATQMKNSLSLSLTKYYPFAGTFRTDTRIPYVDCNHRGVTCVVAKINSQLNTFQHYSEQDETFDQLFVDGMISRKSVGSNSLLSVQLNQFACGGVAVAVSMSHVIGDGSTLASFLSYWASMTRFGSSQHKEVLDLNPNFIIHAPSTTDFVHPHEHSFNQDYENKYVSETFLFPNSKLSDLKRKVIASGSVKNPTRVEVLTSLLYKTAVGAETTRSGSFKPSYMCIPVDIRSKFVPKLPQTTVGNYVSAILVKTMHESELLLDVLVGEIKKEKVHLERVDSVQQAAMNAKLLRSKLENEIKVFENVANRLYWSSSFCGFPYNKVDFGWGKPMGVTLPVKSAGISCFVLVDTTDGLGIEARVSLQKENMEIFRNDKEMLSFCQI